MSSSKVSFSGSGPFWNDLKREVNAYLTLPGVADRGFRRLHCKATIIGLSAVGSYLGLVLFAHNLWQVAFNGLGLVLSLNAAGFNIQHDANHGSFSRSKRANRLAGYVLDLLGGSSYVWKVKHNIAHHTYTNIDGLDEDIGLPPLGTHRRNTATPVVASWPTCLHVAPVRTDEHPLAASGRSGALRPRPPRLVRDQATRMLGNYGPEHR